MISVNNIVVGATPSTAKLEYWSNGTIYWLPSGCCQDGEVNRSYRLIKLISQKGYDSCSTTLMKPETVLIALTGATAGKVGLLKFEACANQSVVGISPYLNIVPKFIFYQLMARRQYILSDCIGSAQPHISKDYITKMYFALPPLAEQERIVAEIEKCEPLIAEYDKLEQQKSKLDGEIYGKLKKSILQYAVQGKLVPQDENDEPASELLKRIRAEKKAKLGKKYIDSYIYKGDDNCYYEKVENFEPVLLENLPFEIPDSWCWARLGDIGDWGAGATPPRANPEYYNGSIPWIKTGELNNGYIYSSEETITEKALQNCSLRYNNVGDILIAMYGATIGKLGIAGVKLTTNQACCACTPYVGFYNLYLFYLLMAEKDYFVKLGAGGAQPNISREKIINYIVPLPPYNEQRRIVERLKMVLEHFEKGEC